MATKKKQEASIEIVPITMGRITVHILGTSPLIMHRFAKKAWEELLFPSGRMNAAEKADNLKHDPLMEYREGLYRNRDPKEPAAFHLPVLMFQKALASAALDLPGASKSQILRLVSITSMQINLFGIPSLGMNMVRSSDMARTPDVRTRPFFQEWACKFEIEFVSSLLKQNQIINLLAASGVIVGVGDWRPQKGGPFGKYMVVDANNKDYQRVVKEGARPAQLAAYEKPVAYDADTEELFAWFREEAVRREKVVPSHGPAPTSTKRGNGHAAHQ